MCTVNIQNYSSLLYYVTYLTPLSSSCTLLTPKTKQEIISHTSTHTGRPVHKMKGNLTKVRPLFTLSHRGSDNSRLLIVFSANNIDQSIGYFYATESRLNDFVIFKNTALFKVCYLIG